MYSFKTAVCAVVLALSLPSFLLSQAKSATPQQAKQQVEQQKQSTAPAPAQQPQGPKAELEKSSKKGKTESKKAEEPKKAEGSDAKKEDEKPKDPMSTPTFNGLKLRAVGPAKTSGRVLDLAVNPRNRAEYFVATTGGVFKTVNAGTTFTPVFEGEGSFSIGCVTLDPKDPNIVWVGTGERNSQRSVSYGDGVYRSDDGGKSWKNMGLKHSEHIGKIIVIRKTRTSSSSPPKARSGAQVAIAGSTRRPMAGKTWKQVIKISENTGVTESAYDFDNPDIMYAASYQRRRHVYTIINGGPETAIYKSTDGGETWNKLKNGLPTEDMGKIGTRRLSGEHQHVYAYIEAANKKGGVYRSQRQGRKLGEAKRLRHYRAVLRLNLGRSQES